MKIYIVQGTSGEYSDRSDWLVCAFRDRAKAEEHASKAMHRGKEIEKQIKAEGPPTLSPTRANFDWQQWDIRRTELERSNQFDPFMQLDYNGTEYLVLETELQD